MVSTFIFVCNNTMKSSFQLLLWFFCLNFLVSRKEGSCFLSVDERFCWRLFCCLMSRDVKMLLLMWIFAISRMGRYHILSFAKSFYMAKSSSFPQSKLEHKKRFSCCRILPILVLKKLSFIPLTPRANPRQCLGAINLVNMPVPILPEVSALLDRLKIMEEYFLVTSCL